jgi:hypothetical protein
MVAAVEAATVVAATGVAAMVVAATTESFLKRISGRILGAASVEVAAGKATGFAYTFAFGLMCNYPKISLHLCSSLFLCLARHVSMARPFVWRAKWLLRGCIDS